MAVQWVHLGAQEVLVASRAGAWIQRPEPGTLGLGCTMPDSLPVTDKTTRHLLDGAIAAAERAAPRRRPEALTARRWAWDLVTQWHCAHHSVALLPEAIERYGALGRPDLAEFARLKLAEEQGHDQFSLSDLRSLGYDAEILVEQVAPALEVAAGLEYARQCLRGEHPVEFLGYIYALERRVLRLSDRWFAALDAVLPAGVEAASGVRAHATRLDAAHVTEAVAFVTGLPGGDRARIAFGCYRITELYCGPLSHSHPSEADLARLLARSGNSGATFTGDHSGDQTQGGRR